MRIEVRNKAMNSVTRDLANHATTKCVTAMGDVVDLCDGPEEKRQLVAVIVCNVLDAASGIMAAEYTISTGKPKPPYEAMVRALYIAVGEAMERKIKIVGEK